MGGGAGGAGAAGSTGGSGSGGAGGTGGSVPPGALDTEIGCAGVFNPDQMLNFRLGVAPGDWAALLADTSYEQVVQARLRCNGGPEQLVGDPAQAIGRPAEGGPEDRHRTSSSPARASSVCASCPWKTGSARAPTATRGDVAALVAEYLGWRLMVRSGAMSGRAALVTVTVNGASSACT